MTPFHSRMLYLNTISGRFVLFCAYIRFLHDKLWLCEFLLSVDKMSFMKGSHYTASLSDDELDRLVAEAKDFAFNFGAYDRPYINDLRVC
jgi:hypothetical protein